MTDEVSLNSIDFAIQWPEEIVKAFSPDFVAPVVGYLGSEVNESTMGIYEVSAGWCASIRWQRSVGYAVSRLHYR